MRKSTSLRRRTIVLLASTAAVLPSAAYAQDAAPEDAADSTEIIVTAQRRSESLQKVPISLQALGEVALENRNVTSFDDYAKLLPSVGFQSFASLDSLIGALGSASGRFEHRPPRR